MNETVGRILKSEAVKIEGRVQLDLVQPQANKGGPKEASEVSATQQVRILENHPEFTVIEITCCCGARTYLRCEYAGTQALEGTGTIEQVNEQING